MLTLEMVVLMCRPASMCGLGSLERLHDVMLVLLISFVPFGAGAEEMAQS